uniref:DNA_LIGASE_A3 domain-containing protein n=1 Tax=Steinernema glaseri TaxID=37863 RepID=A0A1I7ZXF3_9BILA
MDSVPFGFCFDVMGRLDRSHRKRYSNVEQALTGRWKAAARRYLENDRGLRVTISFEEGEWGYTTIDYYDGDSLDEMLARDSRFLWFSTIYLHFPSGDRNSDDFVATCSKEDILID